MDLPQIDDYRSLFLNQLPLLDVRAPVEYEQGAFPFTENHPLINDQERESIGIEYKSAGQDNAIILGHQLVQGDIKNARVNHWQTFFEQHPDGVLYCFRGGMRSKISQQWIYEKTGLIFPRVKGGYKAMRRFLIDQLESSTSMIQPIMLGGRTGIGKTVLLKTLQHKIDLEGILHHRGSVFGNHVTPQPSQINIENILSIELLKLVNQNTHNIVFEDEAPNIGSRRIPEILFKKMKLSPLVLLESSIDERINITFNEYITEALAEHQSQNGLQAGFISWAENLHTAIDKIQRRLGGVRYSEIKEILSRAIQQQQSSNNTDLHYDWIRSLLVDYYDPMYDYQIGKKQDRIVFSGTYDEVTAYLKTEYNIN
jgi:tRNA 2-selenouridine synthase